MLSETTPKKQKTQTILQGIPASPGFAISKIFVLSGDNVRVEEKSISENNVQQEIDRFNNALNKAKHELNNLYEKALSSVGENQAIIFETHKLMLEDELIVGETKKIIHKEKWNAEYSFFQVMEQFEKSLAKIDNDYLNERAADIRDVKKRVINILQGSSKSISSMFKEPCIIISKELTPSDTINLDHNKVLGFATDFGGRTSHAAIMARSLKVPSVVGLHQACQQVESGDTVIVDGIEGLLIIHPTDKTIKKYEQISTDYIKFEEKLTHVTNLPALTKDAKSIELSANIEFAQEAKSVRKMGAYGVGLYRTEYLYIARETPPSEEEQFEEYSEIVKKLNGQPIIIRTFDLGGDKLPTSFKLPKEENPFLGLRGIRLYRDEFKILFKTQLRAIFRASVFGEIRILFPMIACVSEMRYCHNVIEEVKAELKREGKSFADMIPVGAMIEVPSAAVIADLIAEECDFLSIGTNDLIQYSLAVDRGNEHIAYLYQQFNPAILRIIKDIIQKGHEKGVWVGMCGEMASDPYATMILIGLGIDELSVSPVSLLLIKEIIRRVDYTECENLAERALSYSTSLEIDHYLKSILKKKFKDLLFQL